MDTELTLRPLEASELPLLGKVLNVAFAVPKGRNFLDDFPIWSRLESGEVRFFGWFAGERLVGVAGARKGAAWIARRGPEGAEAPARVPMGIIGAVATSIDLRGHGLATRAVGAALQWLEDEGTVFQVLWGAEHDLYRRHGFELCGEQMRIPLGSLLTEARESGLAWRSTAFNEGWHPGIFGLRRGMGEGLALEARDEEWYSAHQGVRWFWTGPAEAPTAYLAYGRGIDLTGIVHEWGGSVEGALSLLESLASREPEAELFANADLLSARGLPIPEAAEEFLCMARVPDASRLAGALGVELPEADELRDALARAEIFFGPDAPGDLYVEGLPAVFWMWGLDSA